MPRGKKPNPEEVRRWLGAYESGQRIDEIAAASHRARATVKKAIESAQRDAVSSRVREGLLRDAFQSHFADLLQGAIEIRDHTLKSRYRPAFPYPDRRRDLLLGGLREHIPDNGLWSALEQFNRVSRRLELIVQEAQSRIGVETQTVLTRETDLFGEDDTYRNAWRDKLLEFFEALGLDNRTEGLEPRIAGDEPNVVLMSGSSQITKHTANREGLSRLSAIFQDISTSMSRWEERKTYSDAWMERADIIEVLDEEIELLLLKKLVPGSCRLCPT